MKLLSRYRPLRRFALWFLVAEFAVGMGGALTARQEIFPFASWFLFLLVPNRSTDYDLVLRAEGTQPIDPVPFSQADGYALQPHSIVSFQVIQQLGRAVEKGDAHKSRQVRRQIDALFGFTPHLQYDLVRVVYDPAVRYQTGKVVRRETVASFGTAEE